MEKLMDLNKETAHRLWVQQFGKKQRTYDFSGREIAKAAYNDRNSDYGWNVDHILPQSRGGKTADHNLICCHILTNDEKADRFPCFVANGKEFEIQKRQNHYEIVPRNGKDSSNSKEDDTINFLDSAQGLDYWKHCTVNKGETFVGYVKIYLDVPNNKTSFPDRFENFLIELFKTKSIFVKENYPYSYCSNYCYTVIIYDVDKKEDVENLLDDCIILNTYRKYFVNNKIVEALKIICGLKCYESNFDMSLNIQDDIINKTFNFIDVLAIDESVKINTTANKKLGNTYTQYGLYPYNYVFTELDKNLSK